MKAITYTAARQNLAKTMEKVCQDHAPVIVTRKTTESVVIMSLEDYEALEETAYLLRSPKNTRRLIESVAQLEEGRHPLDDRIGRLVSDSELNERDLGLVLDSPGGLNCQERKEEGWGEVTHLGKLQGKVRTSFAPRAAFSHSASLGRRLPAHLQ